MPINVYRSSDPGAPSNPIQVIKSCLVTGYGSKSPAGWSLVEEGANEIAVAPRPPGGYPQYIYVAKYSGGKIRWVMGTRVVNLSQAIVENPYPRHRERNLGPLIRLSVVSNWVVVADRHSMFWAYYPVSGRSDYLFAGYVKPIADGPLFRPARLNAYFLLGSYFLTQYAPPDIFVTIGVSTGVARSPIGDEEALYRALYRGPGVTDRNVVYDGVGSLAGHTLLGFSDILVDITDWGEI